MFAFHLQACPATITDTCWATWVAFLLLCRCAWTQCTNGSGWNQGYNIHLVGQAWASLVHAHNLCQIPLTELCCSFDWTNGWMRSQKQVAMCAVIATLSLSFLLFLPALGGRRTCNFHRNCRSTMLILMGGLHRYASLFHTITHNLLSLIIHPNLHL